MTIPSVGMDFFAFTNDVLVLLYEWAGPMVAASISFELVKRGLQWAEWIGK